MSEKWAPERLPTNRDHFWGSHPPAESNRDDEKVQKFQKWLQTDYRKVRFHHDFRKSVKNKLPISREANPT